MQLLILGGTRFVGRAIVEDALARGHTVTLLNRGQTDPSAFRGAGIEQITADRETQLERLGDRRWDGVIDTCGYVPRVVRASAQALAPRVERYVFISTLAVFADLTSADLSEDSPLATLPADAPEDPTGDYYGPLKAECERVVSTVLAGRELIIRPGLIVGPNDYTDRFTYWVRRIAQAADPHRRVVLAPGRPERCVQFIDSRDLARWTIDLLERPAPRPTAPDANSKREGGIDGTACVFNSVGPAEPLSMGDLLAAIAAAAGVQPELAWIDDAWLLAHGVQPWSDLPLWIPDSANEMAGLLKMSNRRAVSSGMKLRPAIETARDTLAFDRPRWATDLSGGLSARREQELLAEWWSRSAEAGPDCGLPNRVT